jgi:adhesin transport system membrane fusion protein
MIKTDDANLVVKDLKKHIIPDKKDWVLDADWAKIQQEPVQARSVIYMIFLSLFLLIVWAYFSTLDEITKGQGRVVASQQLQIVQSFDGGAIKNIMINEGDEVEKGQPLFQMDRTRSNAKLNETKSQVYALSAAFTRLKALSYGTPLKFNDRLLREAPFVVAREKDFYENNKRELKEQTAIAISQLNQKKLDLKEVKLSKKQHQKALKLDMKQLNLTLPLLKKGAVSELDIINLKRGILSLEMDINKESAMIGRSTEMIKEAKNKINEVELRMKNAWRLELSEVSKQLDSLNQTLNDLLHRVNETEIRSPLKGTIQRLLVNTIGGVVAPGQEMAEITPLDDVMIIEARVLPKDIAFIHESQPAVVKLSAYDFSIYGGIEAKVLHISSDSVTDSEGRSFYIVRLGLKPKNTDFQINIRPGMTADVHIITGKKTILDYILKPILKATSQAMTER